MTSIIHGGPLKAKYYLNSLHFHWGDSDDIGCEHCIDGVRYPLELHIVWTREIDGVVNYAVMGYFFQVSKIFQVMINIFVQGFRVRKAQPTSIFS